jgi:mannitol operon transcriptional antiterminator
MAPYLTSRGKKILYLICNSLESITINDIAKKLDISSRTVLRELPNIESWLKNNEFTLIKKPKIGIKLLVTEIDRKKINNMLSNENENNVLTILERLQLITKELLLLKEPKKLFYFSSLFDVSEATISNDLNKIELWLNKNNLILIRKPGLGVYIEGSEKDIRKCIASYIYNNLDDNQVINLINNSFTTKNNPIINNVEKRLLNLIDIDIIKKVVSILNSIEAHFQFKFAEKAFISIIIHLTISVLRIKKSETVKLPDKVIQEFSNSIEFMVAHKIALKFSEKIHIKFPMDEICYISMHLKSAKLIHNSYLFGEKIYLTNVGKSELYSLVMEMIKILENKTKHTFRDDEILIDGLTQHLRPAINRIKMGFDIRNPLLEDIKSNYNDIYKLSIECLDVINKFFSISMPESEAAFVTMHIGAAFERKKFTNNIYLRVAVSCPSGIGTSRFLASRIQREFSDLTIVDVISSMELDENWVKENSIDFIISTVKIDNISKPIVIASPLLLEKDKLNIDSVIHKLRFKKHNNNINKL